MRRWRWALIWGCVSASVAFTHHLPAQEGSHSIVPRRIVVAAPLAETGLSSADLVGALRAQLAELEVEVVLSSRPFNEGHVDSIASSEVESSALAVVWLGREGDLLSVHFFESAGSTLRERRLPLSGADAASVQEVAVVVRSAVAALLERSEVGLEPTADPAPQQEVSAEPEVARALAPKEEEKRSLLWLHLGYQGQSYAPELAFSQGGAAGAGVRLGRGGWALGVMYSFVPRQPISYQTVSVELGRHPLEAFVRYDTKENEELFYGGVETGLVVDWIRRVTRTTGDAFVPSGDASRLSWGWSNRAVFGFRAGSRVDIELSGGGDWLLQRVPVELDDGSSLLMPHRVRPRILAQMRWHIL